MQNVKLKKKQLNSTVKIDNDKVIIVNVEQLTDWITGYQNAYMESLAVAMNTIGEKISYDKYN